MKNNRLCAKEFYDKGIVWCAAVVTEIEVVDFDKLPKEVDHSDSFKLSNNGSSATSTLFLNQITQSLAAKQCNFGNFPLMNIVLLIKTNIPSN